MFEDTAELMMITPICYKEHHLGPTESMELGILVTNHLLRGVCLSDRKENPFESVSRL